MLSADEAQGRPAVPARRQTQAKWLTLSTVGVIVASALMVGVGVHRVVALTDIHPLVPIGATLAYFPLHAHHIWHRALGRRPPWWPWSLGAMAAITLGMIPVVGYLWLGGALYALATSILLFVSMPWLIVVFAGVFVLPIPITAAAGELDWALYFMMGILFYGIAYAVPVWLVAAMRELRDTQELLAEKAVISERLRIDHELERAVGSALSTIAERTRRAEQQLLCDDPAAADYELSRVVDESRRALAKARRLVRSYRGPSLQSELTIAVDLLRAAGIHASLDLPDDLPQHISSEAREELQASISGLLHDLSVQHCVLTVIARDDQVSVTVA